MEVRDYENIPLSNSAVLEVSTHKTQSAINAKNSKELANKNDYIETQEEDINLEITNNSETVNNAKSQDNDDDLKETYIVYREFNSNYTKECRHYSINGKSK